MKRMLKWLPVVAMVASGFAHAKSWDGYVEVPAKAAEPHRWYTCRKGAEFPSMPPPGAPKCVRAGLAHTYDGDAIPMSLQELLDEHFRAPAGYRAVAVGPLPAISGSAARVKDGSLYVAYRLERQGF
jgi:hypothetical protein